MSEINNTQVDNDKDIDVVMAMYYSLEYHDIYGKTSERLWQYHRDELVLNNNCRSADFGADNNNKIWFKFKEM